MPTVHESLGITGKAPCDAIDCSTDLAGKDAADIVQATSCGDQNLQAQIDALVELDTILGQEFQQDPPVFTQINGIDYEIWQQEVLDNSTGTPVGTGVFRNVYKPVDTTGTAHYVATSVVDGETNTSDGQTFSVVCGVYNDVFVRTSAGSIQISPVEALRPLTFTSDSGILLDQHQVVLTGASTNLDAGAYTTDRTIADISTLIPEFNAACDNAIEVVVATSLSASYGGDFQTAQARNADTIVGSALRIESTANTSSGTGSNDLNKTIVVGLVDCTGPLAITASFPGISRDANDVLTITHQVYARRIGRIEL